jgi:selenide,water dikinase
VRTGGDPRNRAYVEGHARLEGGDDAVALCMDPQTSGGLLAAVAPAAAPRLADAGWWRVGEWVDAGRGIVVA